MEKDEIELIKQVQGGNKMAFQQIMDKYGERVMSTTFHFTKNYQDAEDLYQETFLKIYRNIGSFRFESEFFTWIYKILSNQAYSFYRKRKRIKTVDPGENNYLWETIQADEADNADRETYSSSIREEIDSALQKLSPQQRVVFVLKHYEGKKIKDIAALLDCTEGTIKRYLFRATRKLQTLLVAA